jgi:Spy/CpxP family protein refolding chaperone
MKRNLLIATLGIVAVGLLMGAAWGPGMMHRGMFRDPKKVDSFITWRITDALNDVDATPQQKQQILAIKDRLMPDLTKLMAERTAHHEEIKQLWLSTNLNAAEVRAKIDQRTEEMRQLAYKVSDGVIEAQKILTPEQRQKLADRVEKMHEGGRHPGAE